MSENDMRPFAFLRLTHEAIRVELDELTARFADAASSGDKDAAKGLVASLNDALALMELHADQEDGGLYPLINERFEGTADKEGYTEEHKMLHAMHERLKKAVDEGASGGDALRAASDAVTTWAREVEEHLQHEERVLQPLVSKITANLPAACRHVHDIIDVADRERTEGWQIAEIARGLERGRPFEKLHKFVLALQYSATVEEYARMKETLRDTITEDGWKLLDETGVLGDGRLEG